MTLTPTDTGTATEVGIVGFALNGVKFDPSTAGTCTVSGSSTTCSLIGNTGTWNIEALGQSSFNFGVDDNNAHVQPTGEYHYHGMPTAVLAKLGKGAHEADPRRLRARRLPGVRALRLHRPRPTARRRSK